MLGDGRFSPNSWDEVWPVLSVLFLRWCEGEIPEFVEMRPWDIYCEAKAGTVQLFAIHTEGVIKLVCMTRFVQYPQMKALQLCGAVGEKAYLVGKFLPALEIWAKANGAKVLETYASSKIKKLDERWGFKEVSTFMRKPL